MGPVERAVWYVEAHSNDPVALEDVARACKVSPYHLTRAFAAATGLPLMRYVRGRRLTEAARRLAQGADDILRVALDAGYGSHEAFTRAFREHFGLTPEQVRARGHVNNLLLVEAIEMNATAIPDVAPDRFETHAPMLLAGLVERHPCQSPQGIPAQWQRFGPHINHIPGQVGKSAYGVVYNFDGDGNATFDYLTGVEVQSAAALPAEFQTLQVPTQKYAIFVHKGHITGIRGLLTSIWNAWLPESGYQAAKAPMFEHYGPDFNPVTGLGGFEIWVPLEG